MRSSRRPLRGFGCVVVAIAMVGCGGRQFDADRAYGHLVDQVGMGPRIPGTEGHARTLEYLREHLAERADRVFVHRFETVSPLDSSAVVLQTIVAVFGEDRPIRILFGAHWDTRPIADQEEDEELRARPVPGANDGASGTAVLLELATALRDSPPKVGVDLVLFDGEDLGRASEAETFALGSAGFVRDHPDYRPAFMINLDMVGRIGTRIPKEPHSVLGAGPLVERIWGLGREIGLTVLADTLGPPVFDDHVPFLRVGIPAVNLIDFSDPNWHTTRDDVEHCGPEPLGEIGRLALAIIREAEETLRP